MHVFILNSNNLNKLKLLQISHVLMHCFWKMVSTF